ncbi:hypothetical protein KKG90_03830 [Candidatus Bipolaricaulota bacterium]|nr:hypothetical protein [Candidatus Bipolaricaulota bacterium]
MAFYPEGLAVPAWLEQSEVIVRPIHASDAAADFEALMSSRIMLRMWDQSEWPTDDFTVGRNRADLERHELEHEMREAFTFTVMDPTQTSCLGCVYVHGLKSVLIAMGAEVRDLKRVRQSDACVTFWIRESRLADGLDRRFAQHIIDWFDMHWAVSQMALGTNTADRAQCTLFNDLGFAETWRFPIPGSDQSYLIYLRS